MKILIINDKLIHGGAEMQGIREKKILEDHGHEVYLLTFDYDFPIEHETFNEENNFVNIRIYNNGIIKIFNKFFINRTIYKDIIKTIEGISPDLIHVNNLYLAPKSQFKALESYNKIQTIRDYSAVCNIDTCIKVNGEICEGYKFNNCYKECGKDINKISKIFRSKLMNSARRKYIDRYLCPSERLTGISKKNGYQIECINNPFDFEKFKGLEKNIDFKYKKYLYYGNINSLKGILQLMNAFIEFSKDKNDVELIIAGKIGREVEIEFRSYLNICEKIKYLGYLKYEDMISILETVYAIVVPSVWMENYPNTVLEGQATSTLVIGSTRGGIPDMLSDGKGLLFNVENNKDIIKQLETSYNLSKDDYIKIVRKAKDYVSYNNSFETYYSKIIKEFNKI